jgi:hypothetical protein
MFNWMKRLWHDLGNMTRFEFGCKYVFPIIAVFLTWGVIGHIYIINLDVKKLTPCIGKVTFIDIRLERGAKRAKYYPLKITITGHKGQFRVMDKFKKEFRFIQSEIKLGDTITIYKRNKWQSVLSWGRRNDVYQIEKKDTLIFSLRTVKEDARELIPWILIGAMTLWVIYFLYKRGVIVKKRYVNLTIK